MYGENSQFNEITASDETLRGVEWDSEADRPNPQPIVQWPRFYLPKTILQNPNYETIPIPANHALMLSATNHFCVGLGTEIRYQYGTSIYVTDMY